MRITTNTVSATASYKLANINKKMLTTLSVLMLVDDFGAQQTPHLSRTCNLLSESPPESPPTLTSNSQ